MVGAIQRIIPVVNGKNEALQSQLGDEAFVQSSDLGVSLINWANLLRELADAYTALYVLNELLFSQLTIGNGAHRECGETKVSSLITALIPLAGNRVGTWNAAGIDGRPDRSLGALVRVHKDELGKLCKIPSSPA